MTLTIHLVRHGQSEWNVSGRLQGQTPHPRLSRLGDAQALAVARELAAHPIKAGFPSDLVRAVQTAAPIASAVGVPAVIEVRLREQGMGRLEGMTSVAAFDAVAG